MEPATSPCRPSALVFPVCEYVKHTMTDESTQDVIEDVDDALKKALEHANIYTSHDQLRPSALRAFDLVEDARERLDAIDAREFNND